MKRNQKGFTIVEVIVTVVILGVLAAIALPTYLSSVERARYAQVSAQMGIARREILAFRMETGTYPDDRWPNDKPDGVTVWNEGLPWDSSLDYDHWQVGGTCYIQIGFWGPDGQRDYPLFTVVVPPPDIARIGDDLVMGIVVYPCDQRPNLVN